MPTIFTHPAVPLGIAPWFRRVPMSLVVLAAVCSAVPDVDVIGFRFGIPYGAPLGHRGLTHSILFAVVLAAVVAFAYARFTTIPFQTAFTFLFVAIASHGMLDAMTNGGRGIGFFIPFSNRRYFLPWRPIRVSPIGAEGFAAKARVVLASELRWVWLPFATIALIGFMVRVSRRPASAR